MLSYREVNREFYYRFTKTFHFIMWVYFTTSRVKAFSNCIIFLDLVMIFGFENRTMSIF